MTVDDVEFVIEGASRSQVEESRSSNQPILFGFTEDGREIAVVFEWVDRQTINVITAYEPEEGNWDMAKGRRISQNRLLTPEEAQRNREIEQTTKSEVAEMFARRKAEREGAIERPDEAPGPATVYDMLELNSFITSLREAREAMGLSLTDLSRLTGINRTSLNALELFKNQNPTWGTLARYARAVRRPITLKLGDSTDDEPAETVAAKSEQ